MVETTAAQPETDAGETVGLDTWARAGAALGVFRVSFKAKR